MYLKEILATVLAAVLVAGCSLSMFQQDKVIYRDGQDTWVKLTEANEEVTPLDHPLEMSGEDMETMLESVDYFKPGFFSVTGKEGDTYDLFNKEEIDMMAGPLAEALSKAGPNEWVDFSVYNFRGQAFLGNFIITDGVMFVKDGKLNIAFRNLAVKAAPDSRDINTLDPTESYREFRKIVPQSGQDKVAENWLAIDMKTVKQEKEAAEKAEAEAEKKTPTEERSAKERLKELQELYDEGLITEEEYNKKRKEILEEF